LLYFTPNHRSLSGVEKEIFEVEYFIDISHPHSAPLLCSLNFVSKKFRALGKKDLAIYLHQLLN